MKHFTALILEAALLCIPTLVMAQNVVALYTPSLDFADGAQRNEYINKIAKGLSEKTGQPWEGRAFGKASDFEADRSNISIAILDADYFLSKGGSLKPVAMLSASGQTKRPMKIIAKRGKGDKLYQFRNKRFAVVSSSSLTASFISSSALGNEVKATSYFASLDDVHNVRAAINAVDMGKNDLAMVFDGYDSGFTTIYTTPAVGLPVVAINPALVSGTDADRVKSAAQNLSARTSFITGTTAYSASDAAAYRNIANTQKSNTLSYQPIESSDSNKVDLSMIPMNSRNRGIDLNPFQIQYFPTITEFDKKLEERL